jgi:hypothetical protein
VGQLVRQDAATVAPRRPILAGGEKDVAADRIGQCVQPPGGLGGMGVGVDPNVAEVRPEARLHERPGRGLERPAIAPALKQVLASLDVVVGRRPTRARRSGVPIATQLD